ncbi:hypothetical protein [Glaciimonas sp. PAMC28666]|nr:hypothetical protein [Glaciimonas sp. PAMC28666]QRX81340.1 hypothetical protein JQN73_14265 [Glaciimonas sp. PAMC28666]
MNQQESRKSMRSVSIKSLKKSGINVDDDLLNDFISVLKKSAACVE